jgi:acyl carrier protein
VTGAGEPPLLTPQEQAVAREILRLAREDLAFEGPPPGLHEPLSGRLDSLQLLALVVAVEDRFHVVLADDDAAGVRTLAAVSRLVAARGDPARLPAPAPAPAPAAGGP